MADNDNVYSVTLKSGKNVRLREFKIKHKNLAAQAAAARAGTNQTLLGVLMQEEILKVLIIDINGKAPPRATLDDLDSHFTFPEFKQLGQVISDLMGGEDEGERPLVEIQTSSTGAV